MALSYERPGLVDVSRAGIVEGSAGVLARERERRQ